MIRVLVVEDEKMIRKGIIMTTDWQSLGCQVVGEASNAQEALKLVEEKSPEIILTDIRMKGMSGIEMIEALKSKEDIHFIIISGYSDFEYARSALRLGVTDYLLKPFRDEELEKVLKKVVREIHESGTDKEELVLDFFTEYRLRDDAQPNRYVAQCVKCIEENYMKEMTCAKTAEELGISESYLAKLFKRETGYTYVDYLTHYRMKKAIEIMEEDHPKIYELAYLVGYNDAHYFSNIFKKVTGKSPSSYMKKFTI
ncbi:MAG: response regulator [Clostridia bacterium]|uniref:Stage 0 sporulation protein A homolog n=1 Tax=Proteiniclasticum aestuarii TaxID=2817862 RepID=A0A939KJM3_9CLOT|nr:response regulator [Proteiniclasticum aestuarii]MBO1265186.1 response regulator [Proteiniclasticum aestuarii]NCC78714.1 response regulator [Clostridia bacterium]